MDNLIKIIHQSPFFGNIIETGAGQPLANALLKVSGASNTVNWTFCPYSNEIQYNRYGDAIENIRSVSLEMVKQMLQIEANLETFEKVNMIWVNTFQLKTDGNCSHGWIGCQYQSNKKTNVRYYHITLPHNLSRNKMIELTEELSVTILHQIITENFGPIDYVDGIFNDDQLLLEPLIQTPQSYFVINPKGNWERLETTFRTDEDTPIIIYKGSFNPIHSGHLGIIEETQKLYSKSPVGLMISINTYQKNQVDINSLQKRLKALNNKGFYVIITCRGMYAENIDDLTNRLPNQKWIFPLGWDTFVRLEDELINVSHLDVNYRFLVFDRDNQLKEVSEQYRRAKQSQIVTCFEYDNPISSTQIRNEQ